MDSTWVVCCPLSMLSCRGFVLGSATFLRLGVRDAELDVVLSTFRIEHYRGCLEQGEKLYLYTIGLQHRDISMKRMY